MDLRYSASYNYINPNFVIHNIPEAEETKYSAVFCVAQNILNRSACIKPSKMLQAKYGRSSRELPSYTIDVSAHKWEESIKGGADSNPALLFYKEILKRELGGVEALFSSFVPECPMDTIIYDKKTKKGECVDFYSPLLKLVVEIDGSQHSEQEQSILDSERDEKLRSAGVFVARVQTKYLNSSFDLQNKVRTAISKSTREIEQFIKYEDLSKEEIAYLTTMRFQLLVLELLKSNLINPDDKEWNLFVVNRENIDKEVFELALADLEELVQHIAILQGDSVKFPKTIINFIDEDMFEFVKGIKIDFSINKRYDEEVKSGDIYVRNDYFLYSKDAECKKSDFCRYKNYFTVANADIKYDIDITDNKHHTALLFLLERIFGFTSFNPNQEEIIQHCLNSQAVIGLLPTSAGKSLCYQMSALLLPGSTLVVAPLNALMEDQYNNLVDYGISNIVYYNSTNKDKFETIRNNRSLITIVSPERFFSLSFTTYLSSEARNYQLIAIDEVHCLSEWGHDFRTSYLCLFHSINEYFRKDCRLIGLTATASPNVADDIVAEFNSFRKNTLLISAYSLERKELTLCPLTFENNKGKFDWLVDYVKGNVNLADKTVVFTKFVGEPKEKYPSSCTYLSSEIARLMNLRDSKLVNYYASASNSFGEDNSEKMQDFKSGKTRLLFSTKAFGMGVNIPDIRTTIHYGLPSSIESLYQEFGRAGRDKQPSKCYILLNKETSDNLSVLNSKSIIELKNRMSKMNELNGNLYFLTSSNSDVKPETNTILSLYKFIKDCKSADISLEELSKAISDTDKNARNVVDKSLYRLFLLGLINMWGMVFSTNIDNPTYTNLKVNEISIEKAIENLEGYIGRYNLDAIDKYKYEGEKDIQSVIYELVKWSFEHFTQNQIDSLRNLYEYCSKYKTSAELMKAIVQFLTADPGLRGVLDDNTPENWFDYLKSTNPEERIHKINRMMESYGTSIVLDFLFGITKFQLDDFDNQEGERRVRNSLEAFKKQPGAYKRKIVLNMVKLIEDKTKLPKLIKIVLEYMPEYLNDIYLVTQDEYCEFKLMEGFNEKLERIRREFNVRHRKDG